MTDNSQLPLITVIIVNFRTPELTIKAVEALCVERERLPGFRVMVVDGGSGDNSADLMASKIATAGWGEWVELLALPINGGFGWANNQAILRLLQSEAPPDYLHLLNPDAMIQPGAVSLLAEALDKHPRCAVVGSLLLNEDGSTSGSAFRFHSIGREFLRGSRTNVVGRLLNIAPVHIENAPSGEVDWVTGASMMIRAAALREAGLFDSGFFLYFEEVELMWRLKRSGWSIRHEPSSRVVHIGGASTGMTYEFSNIAVAPALPPYWFRSRRRLFVLLYGSAGGLASGFAWLLGHCLFMIRRTLRKRGAQVPTHREARDLIKYGLVPIPHDTVPEITAWDEQPDRAPAWMVWAGARK